MPGMKPAVQEPEKREMVGTEWKLSGTLEYQRELGSHSLSIPEPGLVGQWIWSIPDPGTWPLGSQGLVAASTLKEKGQRLKFMVNMKY